MPFLCAAVLPTADSCQTSVFLTFYAGCLLLEKRFIYQPNARSRPHTAQALMLGFFTMSLPGYGME